MVFVLDFADVLHNDRDIDGDELTVSSLTQPQNGTASIFDGVIRYSPATDFSGIDEFTYEISDGELTSSATITVTVEPRVDDHGDTPADATLIQLGSSGLGTESGILERTGDGDFFRFEMPTDGVVQIDLTSDDGSVDTYLRLYNADGKRIARNNNGGRGTNSRLVRQLTAGTYFVSARAKSDTGAGNYEVAVQ